MKVIIAGSRSCEDYSTVKKAVKKSDFQISTVLSGTAWGVDTFGEEWAKKRKIPIERYPAQWNRYGKSAGMIRNEEMAENADALIAVWDGESRGTLHMINTAYRDKLEVYIYKFKKRV